jgi:hypothetical protein
MGTLNALIELLTATLNEWRTAATNELVFASGTARCSP